MNIKKIFIFSFLILTLFSCNKKSENKEENKDKEENASDVLKVGMELQFPPFETIDEAGKPTGISVDLAGELAKYLGKTLEIVPMSWLGLIPALESGKVDVVISSMTITEDRAKQVDFSIPYVNTSLALLIKKDSKIQNFEDIVNDPTLKVVVKSGTTGAILAAEKLSKNEVKILEDVSFASLEVIQGKADVFIYDPLTLYKIYNENPNTTRINLSPIASTESSWGMAMKKGSVLKEKVDSFISSAKENGLMEQLSEKYLKELKDFYTKNNLKFIF